MEQGRGDNTMICASLFNGCGVGAIAMIRANLPITKFYYSEIDKYAKYTRRWLCY